MLNYLCSDIIVMHSVSHQSVISYIIIILYAQEAEPGNEATVPQSGNNWSHLHMYMSIYICVYDRFLSKAMMRSGL